MINQLAVCAVEEIWRYNRDFLFFTLNISFAENLIRLTHFMPVCSESYKARR